jgi:cation diffusion facilitator CzcD-associated flavoprotein CzcO
MYGTFEFPDFPMHKRYGVKQWEHVPGPVVHKYLTDYAKAFDIYECIRLNTRVDSIEELTGDQKSTWKVQLRTNDSSSTSILANKLIIACGLTTHPNKPDLRGASSFNAPLLHAIDLGSISPRLLDSNPKDIVVLGASKSAWDAAYIFARNPNTTTTVHLVIRTSGNGPTWIAKAYATPLLAWAEKLLMRRAVSWFSPCIFGESDGYASVRNLLHGTRLGQALVSGFLENERQDMLDGMSFSKDAETAKLAPETQPFWVGTQLAIDNYDVDFLDLVKQGRVKVHRADVDTLIDHGVNLSNGETLHADALICCTGWQSKPPLKLVAPLTEKTLGLPYYTDSHDPRIEAAETEILSQFPMLKDQPKQGMRAASNLAVPADDETKKPNVPMRLYKGIVPPAFVGKRNLGYIGYVTAITGPNLWHLQALWLAAFLSSDNDTLDALRITASEEDIEREAILHAQWGKMRAPLGQGPWHLDLFLDQLPYCDMLLQSLGLSRWRKCQGWFGWMTPWKEWFEAYGQSDYRSVVEEWLEKSRKVA